MSWWTPRKHFGPFTRGTRESSRLAWRQVVADAARELGRASHNHFRPQSWHIGPTLQARRILAAALAAPKPWARGRNAERSAGKINCSRQGGACNGYCDLDGVCPTCWNDPSGVEPHRMDLIEAREADGKWEFDSARDCPNGRTCRQADDDYSWWCGCTPRKCPACGGGFAPKKDRARLRRKRRAAQRRGR